MFPNRIICQHQDYVSNNYRQEPEVEGRTMAPPPMNLTASAAAPVAEKVEAGAEKLGAEVAPQTPAAKTYAQQYDLPEFQAQDDAAFAQMSQLRQALYALMKPLNGATVGTAEFDFVMTEDAWKKRKGEESASAAKWAPYEKEQAEYNKKVKAAKDPAAVAAIPKPSIEKPTTVNKQGITVTDTKLDVLTTCIQTQANLLQGAFGKSGKTMVDTGVGESYKYNLGTTGKRDASNVGAWTDAKRSPDKGDGPRPMIGDILVLSKRGDTLDKLQKEIEAAPTNRFNSFAKPMLDLQTELARLEGVQAGMDEAKKAAAAAQMPKVAEKLAVAKAKFDVYYAKQKATLDKMRDEVAKKSDSLAFSHVDYLVRIEKNYVDPKEPGVYKEKWLTMDGGATVKGKQGSRLTERIYTPSRNEISGEASQGGDDRWLAGWIDLDKLTKDAAPA